MLVNFKNRILTISNSIYYYMVTVGHITQMPHSAKHQLLFFKYYKYIYNINLIIVNISNLKILFSFSKKHQ